jgi:hypothetical protein
MDESKEAEEDMYVVFFTTNILKLNQRARNHNKLQLVRSDFAFLAATTQTTQHAIMAIRHVLCAPTLRFWRLNNTHLKHLTEVVKLTMHIAHNSAWGLRQILKTNTKSVHDTQKTGGESFKP